MFGKRKNFSHPDAEYANRLIDTGNRACVTTDPDGFIYVLFTNQNRLEKYDGSGNPVWQSDRKLPFKIEQKVSSRFINYRGRKIEIKSGTFSQVSLSLDIDTNGRLWALSVSTKMQKDFEKTGQKLQLFSRDGVLLGMLPIPFKWIFSGENSIRISGDRIFFFCLFNDNDPLIREYRITDM